MKTQYSALLLDPKWQKTRLRILERAGWKCEKCEDGTQTLHVHHRYYVKGRLPWDYPDCCFQCLCSDCHEVQHQHNQSDASEIGALWQPWEMLLDMLNDADQICGEVDNLRCENELPPKELQATLVKAIKSAMPVRARYGQEIERSLADGDIATEVMFCRRARIPEEECVRVILNELATLHGKMELVEL